MATRSQLTVARVATPPFGDAIITPVGMDTVRIDVLVPHPTARKHQSTWRVSAVVRRNQDATVEWKGSAITGRYQRYYGKGRETVSHSLISPPSWKIWGETLTMLNQTVVPAALLWIAQNSPAMEEAEVAELHNRLAKMDTERKRLTSLLHNLEARRRPVAARLREIENGYGYESHDE